MTLGDRIEHRRKALNLSQSELARRIGAPTTTVNSLIRGKARTTPYLVKIARELNTTPAFLTGETDDPECDAPDEPAISSESRELAVLSDALAPADRRALLQIARSMAGGGKPSETVHAPGRDYRGNKLED